MTRLLSIDPGIRRTAVAVLDLPEGKYTVAEAAGGLLELGSIQPSPKDPAPERYGYLADGIRDVVRKFRKRDMAALVEVPSYAGIYTRNEATYQSIQIL